MGTATTQRTKIFLLCQFTSWYGTDRTGTARKFTRKRGARTKLLFYQYNSGALAREACQRSTMGKKIWETIHPRKFRDDVAYERRSSVHPLHVSRYQVSQLSGARNK